MVWFPALLEQSAQLENTVGRARASHGKPLLAYVYIDIDIEALGVSCAPVKILIPVGWIGFQVFENHEKNVNQCN